MTFELSLWDIGLWCGVSSAVILTASEVVSPYYGRINIRLNTGKLRMVGILFGISFLAILSIKLGTIIRW